MPSGPIVKAIRCNIFQSRYPIGTSKSLENMGNHNEGSQQVGKTMSRKAERRDAIEATITKVRQIMDSEVAVASLETVKAALLQLCIRTDLFNFEEFPLPEEGVERTCLIHEDAEDRYAL